MTIKELKSPRAGKGIRPKGLELKNPRAGIMRAVIEFEIDGKGRIFDEFTRTTHFCIAL